MPRHRQMESGCTCPGVPASLDINSTLCSCLARYTLTFHVMRSVSVTKGDAFLPTVRGWKQGFREWDGIGLDFLHWFSTHSSVRRVWHRTELSSRSPGAEQSVSRSSPVRVLLEATHPPASATELSGPVLPTFPGCHVHGITQNITC